ncbi:hypothetical protein GLW08_21235 [Pontibacillus yanchengensis]|uniref:Uncharacterized protein n=2 Tax=Pontibacillus yanchengensis TaxID=462910 RepID=A0ACC7VLW2_9BACI|nr:helix-turn-helix domain-containing protein [Pontibacillus yanchengensis]MYL35519.1 hypothetical protein [Pontibacillus yanchengensis]MYL55827.1 hypothetical protein [Pontibacillus yanchengensis]
MISTVEQLKEYLPDLYEELAEKYESISDWTGVKITAPLWESNEVLNSFLLHYTTDEVVSKDSDWKTGDIFENYATTITYNRIINKGKNTYMDDLALMLKMGDVLDSVMSIKEAEKQMGLPDGTIRRDISRGKLGPHMVRKSGNTWLITKEALKEIYSDYAQEFYIFTLGFTHVDYREVSEVRSLSVHRVKSLSSLFHGSIGEIKKYEGTEYDLQETPDINGRYKEAINEGLTVLEWVISQEQFEQLMHLDLMSVDYTQSLGLFKDALATAEYIMSFSNIEDGHYHQSCRLLALNLCQSIQEHTLTATNYDILDELERVLINQDTLFSYIEELSIDSNATNYLKKEVLGKDVANIAALLKYLVESVQKQREGK